MSGHEKTWARPGSHALSTDGQPHTCIESRLTILAVVAATLRTIAARQARVWEEDGT
jgi:hypothetical protein